MAVGEFDFLIRTAGPKLSGEHEKWMGDALCAETDPDLFFPEKGDEGRAAKRICGECPVRAACLEYALTNNLQLGIWGGMAIADRRKLAAAARRSAA